MVLADNISLSTDNNTLRKELRSPGNRSVNIMSESLGDLSRVPLLVNGPESLTPTALVFDIHS